MTPQMKEKIEKLQRGEVPAGYRSTEIGILPDNWQCKELREICEPITQVAGTDEFETLSISAGLGFVNQAEKFGKELSGKQYEKYKVLHKGDFSYNKGNSSKYPQGCIYRLKDRENAAVPNVFESFRLKQQYCADYYDQLFTSGFLNRQLVRKINHGIRDDGLLNLTEKDFYSCLLPVPPIDEQKSIAVILNTHDDIIALYRQKTEQLLQLKKTCLSKLFPKKESTFPEIRFPGFTKPWEQCNVSDITTSYSGGTPQASNSEYYNGEIPFIRSGEINGDHTELFITQKGMDNSSAKMVSKGDILYALYGATSGEVSRAGLDGAINQAILAIIPKKNNNTDFLVEWFRKEKNNIIDKYLQGGQGNLSAQIIKNLEITIPSFDEQNIIGQYFSGLNTLITLHQRMIEELQQEKRTLFKLLLMGISISSS